MRRVLLDTNLYADFKRGEKGAAELLRTADEIVLSAVVLGELLSGFAAGRREVHNRAELALFLSTPRVKVVGVDETTADFYARVFALLRRKGRPIPTNDLWIAASALQHGLILATRDEHFGSIEGLATVQDAGGLLP
jgi:predicted nucleic acid-binding protein